jgi:hypothetical protein
MSGVISLLHECMHACILSTWGLRLSSLSLQAFATWELRSLNCSMFCLHRQIVSCSWFWQFGAQLVLFVDCEPVLNLGQDVFFALGRKLLG